MNDLEKYFTENNGNLIHKYKHYFDIYDRHFSRFRGTDVHVLEIGVSHGGSLQMWKSYFGPRAKIYGVDINPDCKQLEEEQIYIFIADQADRGFLSSLLEAIPRIDILIDDGGHTMAQQINTFEVLFPILIMREYICVKIYIRRTGKNLEGVIEKEVLILGIARTFSGSIFGCRLRN